MTAWTELARVLSPIEDRPRIATGLEWARYTTRAGAPYVVLHNPATLAYARVEPREFELLALMDGQHSVKELVIDYFQRFNVLAPPRVVGLVALLRDEGMLSVGPRDVFAQLRATLRPGRRRTLAGELRLRNIDVGLERMYRAWGHYFFNRAALTIGVGLGALNVCLVLLELARGRYVAQASGVLGIVLVSLFALAIHELGHGLAVKHAGRHVYRAGIRLYFGLPAAYVDTSEVWLAPPSLRLLTGFAGPWTGLALGGLFATAATVLPTGWPGGVCFTAGCVFLVDNLFNFNPLLELDGYYVLIDFLDSPLLRPRALAFVRGPMWRKWLHRERLSRDEWLLAGFGIGSLAYAALAITLALRAWQALLQPLVLEGLTSADVAPRIAASVVLLVIAALLAIMVMNAVRGVAPWLTRAFVSLRRSAEVRRYREALAALRAVPMWSDIPGRRLLEVARAMRRDDVARGVEVVRQGEPGRRFYLVARGVFEVVVDGQPVVRLGPGDYFGERALLHQMPRAATVVTVESGRLFTLDQANFDALVANDLAVLRRIQAAVQLRDELAQMPLLNHLAPADLDLLLAHMTVVDAEPGESVIRQGDAGQRFYIVRFGALEVERDGEVLARLHTGDAFGEIALLLDVPRTATVRAAEPTSLLALEASDFRDLLASYLGRDAELQRLSYLRLRSHKRLDEIV